MDLYPQTVAYIKKAYSKEQDHSKLIKKVSNRFAISDQSARAWIESVTGLQIGRGGSKT